MPSTLRQKQAAMLHRSPTPVAKTANYTITVGDQNKIIGANAADLVFTLPTARDGLRVIVYVMTASSGTGLTVTPATGDKFITGSKAANDTLVNTAATDAVGDCLILVGSSTQVGWFVVGKIGTWA